MKAESVVLACSLVVLAACGTGNSSSLVEQREVTAGEYNGLVIGMDRGRTLEAAKALGAQVISVTPCNTFRVSAGSSSSLPSLTGLEGIRLTDSESHFEDIYFADGKVSRIAHTPGTDLLAGVGVGDDIDVVGKRLITGVSTGGLAVTPIVDMGNGGVVTLSGTGPLPANPLGSHNCWRFEINSVAPAGATYEIEFHRDSLKRVLYRRPRVRVD